MKVSFKDAARLLASGGVVAVPTETVYGLAARADNPRAIARIFKIKGRPADNPLIVHVANLKQMQPLVKSIPEHISKIKKFWPGPLTVVMPANKTSVPGIVRAGLSTVALRIPAHPLFLKLLKITGPLAAPSANPSGYPSPTSAAHVLADYKNALPVLDGGQALHGVESTVIFFDNSGEWQILRAGAISSEMLAKELGPPKNNHNKKRPAVCAPGMKYRHYAPQAKLVLVSRHNKKLFLKTPTGTTSSQNRTLVIGFDDTKSIFPVLSLGKRTNPRTHLRRLYALLRKADALGYKKVLVDMDFGTNGLGDTLRERLFRASKLTKLH